MTRSAVGYTIIGNVPAQRDPLMEQGVLGPNITAEKPADCIGGIPQTQSGGFGAADAEALNPRTISYTP